MPEVRSQTCDIDVSESLGQQRKILRDFMEKAGVEVDLPNLDFPCSIVEVDKTELVQNGSNGSGFFVRVKKLFTRSK